MHVSHYNISGWNSTTYKITSNEIYNYSRSWNWRGFWNVTFIRMMLTVIRRLCMCDKNDEMCIVHLCNVLNVVAIPAKRKESSCEVVVSTCEEL